MNTKIAMATAVLCTSAASAAPNILFYGNSYTHTGEGVPTLVQRLAVAGGHQRPNVEKATVSGQTLYYHRTDPTQLSYISNPVDFTEAAGFQWDFVVMQDLSTRPTDIPNRGNPVAFKEDARLLYQLVKDHSASVTPILYETWTRSPYSSELATFYPSLTAGKTAPYHAAATQMQSELTRYYHEAASLIGSHARVAPVGEAFEAGNYTDLYLSDLSHPSDRGVMLSSLVMYQTLYQTPATDITFAAISAQMSLSSYGINDPAQWNSLTALASSVVPEPSSLAALGAGSLLALRRRRS